MFVRRGSPFWIHSILYYGTCVSNYLCLLLLSLLHLHWHTKPTIKLLRNLGVRRSLSVAVMYTTHSDLHDRHFQFRKANTKSTWKIQFDSSMRRFWVRTSLATLAGLQGECLFEQKWKKERKNKKQEIQENGVWVPCYDGAQNGRPTGAVVPWSFSSHEVGIVWFMFRATLGCLLTAHCDGSLLVVCDNLKGRSCSSCLTHTRWTVRPPCIITAHPDWRGPAPSLARR